MIKTNDGYYHFEDDLANYPDAWCYIVWSRRGPGKTYSSLWHAYKNHLPILYMKRTIEDVNLICANNELDFDPSPYVPINRDKGTCIKAVRIKDGIGAFYNVNEEGEPYGLPVSYILALNAIKKFKGFDFSMCEWIIMDEFIPQASEIVKHAEGEQLLDLYMTVARDRQKRGRGVLKLVLFANAEEISTPITNELEIVDDMADLNFSTDTHLYVPERDILLHHITNDEIPLKETEKEGIYKAMQGTNWFKKSFEGSFANNDFTAIKKYNLKNCKPFIHLTYKAHEYYIYLNQHTGIYYMCSSKSDRCIYSYNLNRENEQKAFYIEQCIDLRNRCIEDKMLFQKYTMYDLIINYRKFFKV